MLLERMSWATAFPHAFYRQITKDLEPDIFATLEDQFSKGRGERTVNIELQGKVITRSNLRPVVCSA